MTYTKNQEEFITGAIDALNNKTGLFTCDGKGGSGKFNLLRGGS